MQIGEMWWLRGGIFHICTACDNVKYIGRKYDTAPCMDGFLKAARMKLIVEYKLVLKKVLMLEYD